MARKDVNMLSGSVVKGLLFISIPVMVMNVLQSLFNIVDMTVLKTFDTAGGGSAVGAVGACGSLISMITGLVIGIATITTFLYMCVLRFVWVYAIFPLVPNLRFLYLVWPVGWVLSIVTLLPIFLVTAKKLTKNAEHPALPASEETPEALPAEQTE